MKIRNNLNIKDKIIITEGITDLYYIRAFKNILNYKEDISIAPVCGDSKMLTFIPFIISQGLSFKIVIDTNSNSRTKSDLVKKWGIDEKYIYIIPVSNGFGNLKSSGIEDLFSKSDFYNFLLEGKLEMNQKGSFEKAPNSAFLKNIKGKKNNFKRVIAFDFNDSIKKFNKNDFKEETISNFKNLLNFCVDDDWFHI